MNKRILIVILVLVSLALPAAAQAAPLAEVCRYTAYGAWWDTDRDGIHDVGENYVPQGTKVWESTSSENEMPPFPSQHTVIGTQGSWNATTCVYDNSTVYFDLMFRGISGTQFCIWLASPATSNQVWFNGTRPGSVSQIVQYVGVNYCQ